LEVNPSFPARTVPEFIAYAKANSGKLSIGSGGTGTGGHMSGELFKMMTGVDMVHVPYRSVAPALADLLGGQVQVVFGGAPESIEFIRAGKLRPLAVTTAMRSEALQLDTLPWARSYASARVPVFAGARAFVSEGTLYRRGAAGPKALSETAGAEPSLA
jgi:tripartite-type tricarboxylate transporter receptor subunit TctC